MKYPVTPDGRYFVVGTTLWRCSNPHLAEVVRERLVKRLMRARRDVGVAKRSADAELEHRARRRVDAAKRALGERGPVWWTDGAPDLNQHKVTNTAYANWFTAAGVRRGRSAKSQ